jgi:hypothetical protein
MKRKFTLFLLLCFSISFLGLTFHHHQDGVPHDDCSLCFNVTHQANLAFVDVPQIAPPTFDISLISLENTINFSGIFCSLYSNRAPPA